MSNDEIIKALRYCANYDCTSECPRAGIGNGCIRGLKLEAADAIEELQQKTNRVCGTCRKYGMLECTIAIIERRQMVFLNHDPNWFCGDWEE